MGNWDRNWFIIYNVLGLLVIWKSGGGPGWWIRMTSYIKSCLFSVDILEYHGRNMGVNIHLLHLIISSGEIPRHIILCQWIQHIFIYKYEFCGNYFCCKFWVFCIHILIIFDNWQVTSIHFLRIKTNISQESSL